MITMTKPCEQEEDPPCLIGTPEVLFPSNLSRKVHTKVRMHYDKNRTVLLGNKRKKCGLEHLCT